jgi:hypothetical protein
MMRHKLLEKQEQVKLKIGRWKEIIKSGQKLMKWRQKIQRINEKKLVYFKKINKIVAPLVNLNKRKRKKTQLNKIRDKKVISQQIPIKLRGSLGIFRNLYFNKLENLGEMDKFLDKYDLPKLIRRYQPLKHIYNK